MHAIDTNGAVADKFDSGDPLVPRLPTQVDKHWLNAVQEELLNILVLCGVTPVKGTWTQLRDVLVNKVTNQVIAGLKTFTAKVVIGSGPTGTQMLEVQGDSTVPLVKMQNSANGLVLEVQGVNGKPTMRIVPTSTLPTTNASGAALGPADEGAMVYLTTPFNKLYVYDGTTWNACW